MKTTVFRSLLISTLLIGAVPATADVLLPGSVSTTANGSFLVDANGRALYTFGTDANGAFTCVGDCAAQWVPLPVAADAVASGDWTIVLRDDGTRMWAFRGQPVYTRVGDTVAGDATIDAVDGFHLLMMAAAADAAAAAAMDGNGMAAVATIGATTAGPAWVDSRGMTLYTFDKDANGRSMCNGECAVEWPPLRIAAGSIATADWTPVLRDDGTQMWAYKGQPLYTFIEDKVPGDVTGDGEDGFHLAM